MPVNFPCGVSSICSPTSRRARWCYLPAAPAAALAAPVMSPWEHALTLLHDHYEDEPAVVIRTKDGRSLSRWRYHRAEGFFPDNETRSIGGWHRFLYFSGITAQLGLSAHLLAVGFPDEWNARYVGLRVAKSLYFANATGLGTDCSKTGWQQGRRACRRREGEKVMK